MPINVNGTAITAVNVNGSPISVVNVNGVTVWTSEPITVYTYTSGAWDSRVTSYNLNDAFYSSVEGGTGIVLSKTKGSYTCVDFTIDVTAYSTLRFYGNSRSNGTKFQVNVGGTLHSFSFTNSNTDVTQVYTYDIDISSIVGSQTIRTFLEGTNETSGITEFGIHTIYLLP